MSSMQGQFLVAAPKLMDSNFYQSVVLMVEHGEEGALGLILNRPTTKSVREIWKVMFEQDCELDEPLYLGGPVEGPLMALHGDPLASEKEVLPGLHLAAQRDHIDRLVEQPQRCRIFSGYAGWGGGQLEHELEAGGWLLMPATIQLVFSDADHLWDHLTRTINLNILLPPGKKKHLPDDPSMN